MRAASRLRLPLATAVVLISFMCLISSSSALGEPADPAPYLDPTYASKLLALVQDTPAWTSAEQSASGNVQSVLGEARLAAIMAGLPEPSSLYRDPWTGYGGRGQIAIKPSAEGTWNWAAVDTSRQEVYTITMSPGLGTAGPTLPTLGGSPVFGYWRYVPDGQVRLIKKMPPWGSASDASFTTTMNDGNPIWALTFGGYDGISAGWSANLLLDDCPYCYGLDSVMGSLYQWLQVLGKGTVTDWEQPVQQWCFSTSISLFPPWAPYTPSTGRPCAEEDNWRGDLPAQRFHARWMDASAIPNNPIAVSTPQPYPSVNIRTWFNDHFSALGYINDWDLDAARAVIGSDLETTNWVNCQLLHGPTTDLSGCAPTRPPQSHGIGPEGPYTASATASWADPVNTENGNFYRTESDASLSGPGVSFELTRTYNSLDETIGLLGKGWASSLTPSLIVSGDVVQLRTDTGQRIDYTAQSDGSYSADSDVRAGLTKTDSGYALEIDDQTIQSFDAQGRIVSWLDRNDVGLTYSYDDAGRLTSVADGGGRITSFERDAEGHLIKATLADEKTVSYAYDGDLLTSVTDAKGAITSYAYDAADRMTKVTDPNGDVVVQNTYDDQGRVISQTDALGQITTLDWSGETTKVTDAAENPWRDTYNEAGQLATRTDPLGNTTRYSFDGANNLLSYINERAKRTEMTYDERGNMLTRTTPDGATESWTYNADDQVTSHTDQLGNISRNEYDANGNLVREIDPSGAITTSTYDGEGKLLTQTDPLGHVTTNVYGENGDLAATISPSGAKTTMHYDEAGRLVAEVDPIGNEPGADPTNHTTGYEYDANGNVVATTDPLSHKTKTVYDDAGRVASETDARGNVTSYEYDAAGRKISETAPDGGVTRFTYDVLGKHVISETDPLGNVTRYTYDKAGHRTSVESPSGATTTYTYDGAGNQLSTTDPLGNTTITTYDAMNRAIESTDARGGVTKTAYDLAGHVISVTDPLGRETLSEYDVRGNLIKTIDALGHVTTSTYDAGGQLISETDENGHTTSYTYDSEGRRTSVTSADGSVTHSAYDSAGNLIESSDANGHKTTYSYDAAGNKTSKINPLGKTWTYTYDANGNEISSEDPLGRVTKLAYDSADRETEEIDALGGTSKTAYDLDGRVVSVTDPRGYTTTSEYDSDGNLVKAIDPLGHETVSTYDAAGQLISETDTNGNTTSYSYDALGRKTSTETATGAIARSTFDAVGNLIAETDANGNTTRYQYDAAGRKTGMMNALGSQWTYSYDAAGNLVSTTDPLGNVSGKKYDAVDREIETTDALDRTRKTEYDAVGNVVSTIDPLGRTTGSEYDAAGNLVKTTDPLGHERASAYDAAGQLVAETDANGHSTSYQYDANGEKVSVAAPDGSITRFEYDAAGNLLRRTDANGHATSFEYDALNQKVGKTNPLGSRWTYSHDGNGNLIETAAPSGGTITQAYDAENRLTRKSYSDGTPTVSYSYDAVGNRVSVNDGTGQTTNAYDAANRLIGVSSTSGAFIYLYDANGNLLSRTYPNGQKSSYLYNALGEMVTAGVSGETTYYAYDVNGNLTSTLHPNGILDTRTYDAAGRLTRVQGTRDNGRLFYSRSYELDAVGNPLSVSATRGSSRADRRGQSASWRESYSYDSQNRLATACMNASCSRFLNYTYDAVGNRLTQQTERGTSRYLYDAADELLSTRGPRRARERYRYDANGNQVRKGSTRYSYNLENELTTVSDRRREVFYTYSEDGLIASKSAQNNRVTYSWDENAPLAQLALETTRAGRGWFSFSSTTAYTYGQGPLGYSNSGESVSYHSDSLGSVVELSDEGADSAGSYRYSPYGEEVRSGASSTREAASNPIRFTGQYLDSDSGLYYMRAREYDPETGRFLELDPKEEEVGEVDLSAYLYADDDPTLLTDPSGLDPRFGGKTLNCKRNKLLCSYVYGAGYKDGCSGYRMRKALSFLAWRGIYFEHISGAANKKGKLVTSTTGPKGPGIYFVTQAGGPQLIEPPKDQSCGWVCSVGFSMTQVFGCNSVKGCIVSEVLTFSTIGGISKGVRLMRLAPKLRKALNIVKQSKTWQKAAKAGGAVKKVVAVVKGTRAAKNAYGGLSQAGKLGIQTYYQLRKAIAGQGLQAHHLIEARFARLFETKAGQMLSIAVTKTEHQIFTNAWRREIAYGAKGTGIATKESVMQSAGRIYRDYPAVLRALGL